ncbi:putative armadillo-like helical protein [Helianthus annuus]|uniref:Armadillo-like helical protein n=3 Tax=Helianthus annuus TaxID=4232 RepID=A0A9K3J7P8_HELAN|nr:putative armadillo-like helical protein [Helianthus annuus]KAJ0589018.1 putative armadillo-like helical protein [Helianthus annuus]KAJ0796534.1 putative armadillo-like helical protein [Helianthus annuus]KAJ0931448.1 putative armadillo-like helical protein [Helianthus annuus]
MIMEWSCKNNGGPFELFVNEVVAEIQKKKISGYTENINSINPMDKRRTALMLRALTHFNEAHCLHLAYPVTVYNIVKVLVQHEHNDEEFEEDLHYTVYHIAVHEANRGVLCEYTMLILFLINGLEHGKPDTIRKICASTIRELSYVRDNQEKLGQSGAVKTFIGVLKRRDSLIQNDAAKSLLYLCENPKNTERILVEGGVELLYEWISSKELVVEVVKLLVKITENALVCLRWRNINGIRLLFSTLKDDDCAKETKLDFLDCLINVCGLDPNSRMDMRGDDNLVAFILELGKSKEHLVKVKARELMNKINNRAKY